MTEKLICQDGQDFPDYDAILTDFAGLVEEARRLVARTVNASMTVLYWLIGRRIDSQFYDRTALSKDEAAMLTKGQVARPEDAVTAREAIKAPYALEFLDLKIGAFTPVAAGQMHLYPNYASENPPVGLIFCILKDVAVAHYALDGLPDEVTLPVYRTALPDEKELAAEIERTRAALEARGASLPEGEHA